METAKLSLHLPKQDLEIATEPARSGDNAWQELFRVGEVIAAEEASVPQSLTAEVMAMRR